MDSNTNSAGEGFRLRLILWPHAHAAVKASEEQLVARRGLEGFDNPPPLLKSIEALQLGHVPRHAQKLLGLNFGRQVNEMDATGEPNPAKTDRSGASALAGDCGVSTCSECRQPGRPEK